MEAQHIFPLLKEKDKRIEALENEIRSLKISLYLTLSIKPSQSSELMSLVNNYVFNMQSQDLTHQTTLIDKLETCVASLEKSMDGSKISKLEFENAYFLESMHEYKRKFEDAENQRKLLETTTKEEFMHKKRIADFMLSRPYLFNTIFLPNVIVKAKSHLESLKHSIIVPIHNEPKKRISFGDVVETISEYAAGPTTTNLERMDRKRMAEQITSTPEYSDTNKPLIRYLPQQLKRQNARMK